MAKKYVIDARKFIGVYGYDSTRHRFNGKPDVCFYITFKIDGKKFWEKIGWKSEGYSPEIASEERAKRVRNIRHGEQIKTGKEIRKDRANHNRTLNEIKEAYFSSERGLNIKGRKTDLNRYKVHLKKFLGQKRISKISQFHIAKLKQTMRDHAKAKTPPATMANATIANAIELLRRIINHGVKMNLCQSLNFKIQIPKKDNEVTEYLTQPQAKRLIAVLDNWPTPDPANMLKLAWLTGLRRGEVFKLEKRYCDFDQKIITLKDPKGGRDATIPMSEPVKTLLQDQIALKKSYPDSPFVFPGRHGNLRVNSNAVLRIKKKAKLPKKFRIFHGLRHHMAVTLISSGQFTLDMIGELLTHKSPEMTKRYAKYLPGAKKEAANQAAKLLQAQVTEDNNIIRLDKKHETK